MPVVGSSAYNTAGQITSLVRSLLNDSQGNLFTDTVLLPYANSAYRKTQRALGNAGGGGFIQDDVARAVAPLRPKFFVAERRTVTECQQYFFKLCAIVNSGLSLDPGLVLGHLALGLVGQQPAVSILAKAQQFAAFS